MAQQAARSSVELYTTLFFQGKTLIEPAYILRILKNGFVVLIPKYGVEAVVYAAQPNQTPLLKLVDEHLQNDDGSVVLKLFMDVKVEITVVVQSHGSSRSKLNLRLLEPYVAGISDLVEEEEKSFKRLKK